MTEEYVKEANIKFVLTGYSNWLVTTVIPKYFDGDLKSKRTIKLNTSTLKNYLRKSIIMLKENFPKHCTWEETEYNTRMIGE